MAHYPVWFNSKVIHQLHKTKSLRKKVHISPTVNSILSLKTSEEQLANNILNAKNDFEYNLVYSYVSNKTVDFSHISDH